TEGERNRCSSGNLTSQQSTRSRLVCGVPEQSLGSPLIDRITLSINTSPQPVKSIGICSWVVAWSRNSIERNVRVVAEGTRNDNFIDWEALKQVHRILLRDVQLAASETNTSLRSNICCTTTNILDLNSSCQAISTTTDCCAACCRTGDN